MSHKDMIIDADTKFIIDPATREIKNNSTPETVVQNDHNSERFGFVLPRYIEGHDMMDCNRVEIHYKNIDNSSGEEVSGVYEVSDMRIDEDDETRVAFSWLVSQNATQRVGALIFLVRFSCIAGDGTVEYVWNTSIFKGIFVSSGMYNSDEIIEQYADVLERWKAELVDAANMPLVVNITTDSEGTFVTSDKTYDEIYNAYRIGKSVLAYVGYSDMVSSDTSLTPVLTLMQCGAKEAIFSNCKSTDENRCETIVVTVKSSFSGEDTWSIETVSLPSKAYVDEQISNAEEINRLLFSYSHTKGTAPKHDIKPCNFSAGDTLIFDVSECENCAVLAKGADGSEFSLRADIPGGRYEVTLAKDIIALGLFVKNIDENPSSVTVTFFGPYLRDMYVDVEYCKEKVDKNTADLKNVAFSYSRSKGSAPKYDIISCNFSAGDTLIFDVSGGLCNILAKGTDDSEFSLMSNVESDKRYSVTLTKDIKALGLFIPAVSEATGPVTITVLGKILSNISNDIDTINSKIDSIENVAFSYSRSKAAPKYDIIPCNFSAGDTLIFDVNGTKCNILAVGSDDTNLVLKSDVTGGRHEITLSKDIKALGLFVHNIDENPDTIIITVWSPILGDVIKDVDYCKEKVDELGNFIDYGKTLFMGDSITANNSWVPTFVKLLGITEYTNIAVSGSRFRDRDDTVDYDGNPLYNSGATNVLGNQVEKIIRGKDTTHPNYSKVDDYDNFDMIIISCGTNDVGYIEDVSTIESQFIADGRVVPLENVDRKTFAGAMRYCYEKLHNLYPKAHIFFCTPIQEGYSGEDYVAYESYESIKNKGTLIKAIGDRLSVDCIDTFKCGICNIYNDYKVEGEDLHDGLHPNTNGAMKIARYNAKKVSENRWIIN